MENRYDKYKDSGIAWIGEIPEHWNIGYVGKFLNEVNNRNTSQKETNTLQFKMGEIVSKSDGNSKYNPESIESYNIVYPGTIMINGLNLSFDFVSQRVGLVKERGAITSAYLAMKPNDNCSPNYVTYLFKSYDYKKVFHSLGKGLRATLNYNIIRNELIVLPSFHEQQTIAAYLDQKCGEIDELITLQEEMITKLQSYKQSVITEAVTKGLDKNVPLKDSGIEWIGEIPEHWNSYRIKYHFSVISGSGFKNEIQGCTDGEIPVCKASDISNAGKEIFKSSNYLSREIAIKEGFNIIPVGSILFPKIGEAMKKNNRSIAMIECCLDNNCQALIPSNINCIYSYYIFKIIDMSWYDNGGTIPSINNQKLINSFIPYPPLSEQQAIADYLDQRCSEIDELISIKQQKIEKLKEYKKSLIFECVTGKRKVS